MQLYLTVILTVLFFFLSSVLISWVLVSRIVYTTELLKPGETYESCDRTYVFPNVEIEGECFKLKDEVVESIRNILEKVGSFLDKENIEWWITGGTQLGVTRHETVPMHFDDDADIAVELKHREKIFSSEFADKALDAGIDLFTLFGNNSKSADRHGSVVRAQNKNGSHESLDIFFWEQNENDGTVIKLDGWYKNGKNIYSKTEIFAIDDVFPIKKITCDGVNLCEVNRPRNVLEQQYSKKVWNSVKPRPLLISHAFPLRFLNLLFVRASIRRKFGYKNK
jgi:hypothetical protein